MPKAEGPNTNIIMTIDSIKMMHLEKNSAAHNR